MKFKYSKPINLLLSLLLVLSPLLSSQAQVVGAMTMTPSSSTDSKQIQHNNHQYQTLETTPSTEHCMLNSSSAKGNHCMKAEGSCPNHMSCCSIGALLSTEMAVLDLAEPHYLISDPQQIVLLPLPTEIKPPR